MTNGRQKGSVAEREVAALFEPWWRQLEPGCRFVRTPLSGGWHGVDVRKGFKASGDLMTTALHFPWTIEVKRREGWSYDRLIGDHKQESVVWNWWRQAQTQGAEQGSEPMLFLRKSREDWRLMMRAQYAFEMMPMMASEGHVWKSWPKSRGERAILFPSALFLFDMPPDRFVVKEPVTSTRRRVVK